MKKTSILIVTAAIVIFSSSCGVNHAFMLNQNQNATQVHLSNNNFRVVEEVSGSAEVTYVLAFGGMNKQRLYQNAYSEMVKGANLDAGPKALINIVTEEHVGEVPTFFYKRTVSDGANVIEFLKQISR